MESSDKDPFDKDLGGHRSEGRRKGRKKTNGDTGLCEKKKFLFDARKHQRFLIRVKDAMGMLVERQDRRASVLSSGLPDHVGQQFLMPAVETVKIPDRQNQRPIRTCFEPV